MYNSLQEFFCSFCFLSVSLSTGSDWSWTQTSWLEPRLRIRDLCVMRSSSSKGKHTHACIRSPPLKLMSSLLRPWKLENLKKQAVSVMEFFFTGIKMNRSKKRKKLFLGLQKKEMMWFDFNINVKKSHQCLI